MKKELLAFVFLAIIALLINRQAIFALECKVDLDSTEVIETKEILQYILEKRAILFNSLANNESEFLEIKSELRALEIDPLYKYDIEAFALLLDEPSGIDLIHEVNVMGIEDYEKVEDKIMLVANVKWIMEDVAGQYIELRRYRFHLCLDDNIYKLQDYELIVE